jgi:hypothetical protein
MCFSASASFGAGTLLTVIGVASLKKATRTNEKAFASIPFLFGVQQISEGFLWLALSDPTFSPLQEFMTYTFLFFAQIVWPFWVPLAIFLTDPKTKRKAVYYALILMGTTVSVYLAYCLITYPVEASIMGAHIHYQQDYPTSISLYGGILYVLATITPPFFSKLKYMWLLGASILISYIMTTVLYPNYLVSVWCFFASIISLAVYVVLVQMKKTTTISSLGTIEAV